MPLSNNPVVFPETLPAIPFEVECIRSATRSGLERGKRYNVLFVVKNATTHRGENAKGYVVETADEGEVLPVLWHPNRFKIIG